MATLLLGIEWTTLRHQIAPHRSKIQVLPSDSRETCHNGHARGKDEQHKAVWADNIDSDFVGPDGIVLDDKETFAGADLARALEIFPEQRRDTALRELRELLADSDVEDEGDWELDVGLYGVYHSYCVMTHPLIEDEEALDGGELLHVFFGRLWECGETVANGEGRRR
ncbi:hypothetical protein N7519_008596 [Penicillium mononematosum]|uniref:uncharacterized protein n=1 Tax=Penicillium mononematosum TaxID=268346 RepID=UPI002546F67D|nr:uncharacterized protein N7519_008596 [Penicillium mononematosum]KAJ6178135.1 hypothetical protein N7519_008596 [Penicillium mononematosum]